jgi:hypothetical protein
MVCETRGVCNLKLSPLGSVVENSVLDLFSVYVAPHPATQINTVQIWTGKVSDFQWIKKCHI